MEEGWVSTKEAANILHTSQSWIVKLAKEEKLVARQIGKVWTISRASAEAYAHSDRKPGPKPTYAPDPSQTNLAESSQEYTAPQSLEITLRLTVPQMDHLIAQYGSPITGIITLINQDISRLT